MIGPFLFNFEDGGEVLMFKSIVESMIGVIASHNIDFAKKYIKKLRMVDPADDSECEYIASFLRDKRQCEREKEGYEQMKLMDDEFFGELNGFINEMELSDKLLKLREKRAYIIKGMGFQTTFKDLDEVNKEIRDLECLANKNKLKR